MGCGCCVPTFRDEVEDEIFAYVKRLKKHDRTKNLLIHEIQKDLVKRAETLEKYNYPYRNDDVAKTVKLYKKYIYKKLDGHVELIEDKIKKKEKPEKEKNIKKDVQKLKLKEKEESKNEIEKKKDEINEKKEKNIINNIKEKENENKGSMANNKNEENLESILKSELHPILEDKIKNYSEKDESKGKKEKSIDNIQDYLPKKEIEQKKSDIINKEKKVNAQKNQNGEDEIEKDIKSFKSEIEGSNQNQIRIE